jgi:predicted dehydrogenase
VNAAGDVVRWGILGTANIARAQFLPGLAEAGRGQAAAVAGRERAKADSYAVANGVSRAIEGYQALLDDPDIDAVYLALPNGLHAEWATRTLHAGKALLCEKPLTGSVADTRAVLDVAARCDAPLWEAMVFPFQAQHLRLLQLIGDGAIGEVREAVGSFHFQLTRPDNIRFSRELAGGALLDVGCYPVRLASEIFHADAEAGYAVAEVVDGVDVDTGGVLSYPDGRRLLLTCGFRRSYDTVGRVIGTEGYVDLTNPYHPRMDDTLVIVRAGGEPVVERPTSDAHSFTAALRHIHSVLLDGEPPRHLALDGSLRAATGLDLLVQSVGAAGTDGVGSATTPSG